MAGKERWYWIEHKGKRILVNDYSGLSVENVIKLIEENILKYGLEKNKDILLLVDVTGASFNTDVISQMNRIAKIIKPIIKKSAVIGVIGLKAIVLKTVNRVSNLGIEQFNSKDEAKDWLVS